LTAHFLQLLLKVFHNMAVIVDPFWLQWLGFWVMVNQRSVADTPHCPENTKFVSARQNFR
jgi:hypothetical protein